MKDNQRLPVRARTLRQAQVLKAVKRKGLADLTGELYEAAWQKALGEGLVTEKMIEQEPEPEPQEQEA